MSRRRTSSQLSDERIEAVREWIREGAYNDPEVADAVARRILAYGDLRDDGPPNFVPRNRQRRPIH